MSLDGTLKAPRTPRVINALLATSVFLVYLLQFQGYGLDYWDTYIAAPATFAAGRPCVFTGEDGEPAYRYRLKRRLPHDLVDRGSYGIVSKDQRIGAGITMALPYLMFGAAGFRLAYAALGALAFVLGVAAGRRLFQGAALPAALGLIVALNPFMLAMNRLNANFISVPILMGMVALLLQRKPRWLLIGLVYGALGGIRNEAIVLAPALLVLMLSGGKEGRRGVLLFGAGAAALIAPYLAWNKFAFGQALIHASQFSDFDGFRPMFQHSLLGWEFQLNGLFNWPFHDQLVRTPHYPFPTYLTLPLSMILCFGVLLSALVIPGLVVQWRSNKAWFGFLLLWIASVLGLFLFQENWEEPKNTFGALAIPALGVLMVRGMQWIAAKPRCWKRWAQYACIVAAMEGGILAASQARVPVDQRWYVRFPKAKEEAHRMGCLTDTERREWKFFHTDECPAELDEQRKKLTRGNLMPGLYYPMTYGAAGMRDELWRYEPRIFDIWEKIYGE